METSTKEKNIITFLDKILPNVKISPIRAGNSNGVETVKYFISPFNKDLRNSDYFNDQKLKFVHFTNLHALQSIISERCVRLYNLNNLNDPREYSYAGDLLFFNYINKKDAKDNIFIFSMCEEEILTKDSTEIEFNMWRLYGNNGFGVAIIFGFEINPSINWKDYFMSTIHYGAKSRIKLKEFKDFHKELEKEKPMTAVDLGQIVCFHKSKLYLLEQEIRLIFDNRNKNNFSSTKYRDSNLKLISPLIRTDIAKSTSINKPINYLELPIYREGYQPISEDDRIPIPKIEKIIIGYQYEKIGNLTGKIQQLFAERLDYIPIIEKSRLTKYYHDK